MHKSNHKYIRFSLYIILAIVSLALDIFVFKHIEIPHINTLVITCFSALVSIAGIWGACYLLFLELFRDRYQMQVLKKKLYAETKETLLIVICCVLFGSVVMFLSIGIVSSIIFSILTVTTIVEILYKVFNSNKDLMINSHIDKFLQDMETKIANGEKLTYAELKDYRYLYDECIVKEEYYTIQNIVENSGELFRTFLKNSIGKLNPDDLKTSFDAIIKFNQMQLNFCETIKSKLLIEKIAKQQYKNLKFCIDNNQSDWYKLYLEDLKFCFASPKFINDKNELNRKMFYYMHETILYLIEKHNDELAEYTIDAIQEYVSTIKVAFKDTEIDNFIIYNILLLNECNKKNNDIWFAKISEKLNNFIDAVYIENIPFHAVKSYYALVFNYYYRKDKYKALDFCRNTVEIFNHDINCAEFSVFKFYCVDELYKLDENDVVFMEKVFILHIEILQRSMSVKNKPDMILLPELNKLILLNSSIIDKCKMYLNEFRSLLNTCIIENETTHFYKFLNCINVVLIKTKKQDKDIQIALLNIYVWAINRSKNLANKNFYKIAFELLEESIKEMDKERSISDSLGKYIINKLSEFAKNSSYAHNEVVNTSIDLLRRFSDDKEPLYFVLKNSETRKQLYRSLFNIGTNCIENNYEEGVRRISNTLGWAIISCIEQNLGEFTNYLIDRAIDLYDISTKMKVSVTTQIFIITLFTTVGAFCSKKPQFYPYRKRIIDNVSVPINDVRTAAKLRTCESDIWNDILENKTEFYTNEFLKLYNEKHK